MPIRCPSCGSAKTNRSPTSDLRGITYRECEECGYNGKWFKFRISKEDLRMKERKRFMTKIPFLEYSNEGWNTKNLRQCKNCGHWIYYWSIDVPLAPEGWYHYNKLYNPRVSNKLRSKNRKRCFGHNIKGVCTCTNPEPDPDGETWDQVHRGIR